MRIGYYPGCSLHATARELDESLRAVASALDLELQELDDWSCCGATSAHATNHLLSLALPARNLALAEAQGHDRVLAPCAACYNRLATARHGIAADSAVAARVARVLDRPFANRVAVANLVEVLRELGPTIKAKTVRSLASLKVACYYGCLLVRPAEVVGFDDPEQPTSMEEVVRATGATPVAWQMRLECCGGAFSLARTASVVRLGRAILDDARRAGAEALVVACPMCHSNLDFRQSAMLERGEKPLPVLYLSELVGLALGLAPGTLGLQRHFVDARPLAARTAAEVR
ncbi:MAG TPA: CoB--CoM heterodisulfide reductase iron-sulfur subunit B family protein [Thermoanaerobaculaceae bacterium]|nr:CoB--CoM heterodisulfide reductase iron-sulfur subunit B family protein [Thermoanaerobaculaceae bacterium]HPS78626.1 CoB--CoM heterodisulfide reductase iron-sulfur subunit B family protein [Thermoanaerobaculaceae bacterium]